MLIKRSINQLSSSSVWRTVLSTSPLSNSAFTIAIHWTRMPDATQNDTIQTHIDSWHYNDTRCLCVQKLDKRIFYIKKVKYIFTVTHHNDQHSQMNRRGDVCYSNRPIATETYSALFILLWSVCWILSHFVTNLNVLMVHLYLFVVTFSFATVLFVIFVFVFYILYSFQSVCVCHFLVISCPFVSIWCVFLGVLWLVPIPLSDH